MLRPPPISTLFPYTTLFRSIPALGHRPNPGPVAQLVGIPQDVEGNLRVARTGRPTERRRAGSMAAAHRDWPDGRSEEHTSELQSRENLVCRLLLEKKKRMKL